MKLISALLTFAIVGTSVPTFACDTQSSAKPESTCVVLPFMAKRGVWFELELADTLRYRYAAYPIISSELQITTEMVRVSQARIGTLQNMLDSNRKVVLDLGYKVDALTRENDELKKPKFLDSKALWIGVGVVGTVAVIYAVGQAQRAF